MKVAFLGAGRIAAAIGGGLARAGVCSGADLAAFDISSEALEAFSRKTGATAHRSPSAACEGADVVMLCVKPGDVPAALRPIQNCRGLLVSVAAGVTTSRLAECAPQARIIRAMPNTAALAGRSATVIAPGPRAGEAEMAAAENIFATIGRVYRVAEAQMDAVTGLSGSGPAYAFLVVEAMAEGGVAAGLPRPLAQELATATLAGAAALLESTGEHPALLREAVTSPGGTTAAGLLELESAGLRAAFIRAVRAAARRASELSA
ncbi:MAG: pyrroline-5-carboxylate reductase [Terrimicrobiaceae bacterium]|nr:pyrroline-5-carboxylate reductase [Terrimicrobiaceae bacterium]